jgi:CHASE2 domain-containing sensor protein
MFRKFWLDVILGTIFIFAVMGFFASFTAFRIFDVFDPISETFEDLEVTDVVFSRLRDAPVVDERIVLVNMGELSRFEVGMLIDSISQHDPLVIGVDSFFDFPKPDSLGDAVLADALGRVKNLVMVTKLIYNEEVDDYDSLRVSWKEFTKNAQPAFANLITGASAQEDLKMCRTFVPQEKYKGENQVAFAVKLASYLDADRAQKFLDRKSTEEVINYRGNVIDFGATKFGNMFYALDWTDVLEGGYNEEGGFERRYVPEILKDKIVIFCFLGKYLDDRESLEDKFYTPLNYIYAGKSFPDMYGGVIHANIVAMILNEDYINQLNDYQSWILSILLCFVNIAFFTWIYKRIPRWYDGITKLIQLVEILGLLFVMIYVLDYFSLKLNLTIGLVAVALSGDGLEVYFGVVKNLFSREGRKELFRVSRL